MCLFVKILYEYNKYQRLWSINITHPIRCMQNIVNWVLPITNVIIISSYDLCVTCPHISLPKNILVVKDLELTENTKYIVGTGENLQWRGCNFDLRTKKKSVYSVHNGRWAWPMINVRLTFTYGFSTYSLLRVKFFHTNATLNK